jgi:hypothetical protein
MLVALYGGMIYFHFDWHISSSADGVSKASATSNSQVTSKQQQQLKYEMEEYNRKMEAKNAESLRLQQLKMQASHIYTQVPRIVDNVSREDAKPAQKLEPKANLKKDITVTPHDSGSSGASVEHANKESDEHVVAEPDAVKRPITDSGGRQEMILESVTEAATQAKPVRSFLVVCGTDGSGTRKVVQTLTEIGVLMVSEDPETFDIHGDLMGGWPAVVGPVVQRTRTLNYDPEDSHVVPSNIHSQVRSSLHRLVEQARQDAKKPQSFVLAKGGALPRPSGADAKRVSFGFKAPVAMTLVPYWADIEPHFKLLHVLRDGRDIALSANQSPVQKFYNGMYGRDKLEGPVKGIRLWSDWNSQVYAWAKDYVTKLKGMYSDSGSTAAAPEKSFSYMALHTEDLASENVSARFHAIVSLAKWTGSNMSLQALCCVAQGKAEFMGSHDRTSRDQVRKTNRGNQQKEISKRYGKWKAALKNAPNMLKSLDNTGKEALSLFNYEPEQRLYYPGEVDSPYQCSEATEDTEKKCKRLGINL